MSSHRSSLFMFRKSLLHTFSIALTTASVMDLVVCTCETLTLSGLARLRRGLDICWRRKRGLAVCGTIFNWISSHLLMLRIVRCDINKRRSSNSNKSALSLLRWSKLYSRWRWTTKIKRSSWSRRDSLVWDNRAFNCALWVLRVRPVRLRIKEMRVCEDESSKKTQIST